MQIEFNSNTGQLSCSDCPTGTYSDEVGLGSLCKPCSAGMHNNLIGQELNYNVDSKLPSLFLKGENSDYILDSDEDIIRDYFPKAKIATISKAGHWLHAENPKEFIEVTSKWLNKFG